MTEMQVTAGNLKAGGGGRLEVRFLYMAFASQHRTVPAGQVVSPG